jgi:pilus assembly protein Flp/PilA
MTAGLPNAGSLLAIWGGTMMLYLIKARILMDKLASKLRREDGQGMVEYGLILALVGIAAVASLTLLKDQIVAVIGKVKDTVQTVINPA